MHLRLANKFDCQRFHRFRSIEKCCFMFATLLQTAYLRYTPILLMIKL